MTLRTDRELAGLIQVITITIAVSAFDNTTITTTAAGQAWFVERADARYGSH